jgi:hypothetical protein
LSVCVWGVGGWGVCVCVVVVVIVVAVVVVVMVVEVVVALVVASVLAVVELVRSRIRARGRCNRGDRGGGSRSGYESVAASRSCTGGDDGDCVRTDRVSHNGGSPGCYSGGCYNGGSSIGCGVCVCAGGSVWC